MLGGAYTLRSSDRFCAEVTIDKYAPAPPLENKTRGGPVALSMKLNASALTSMRVGSPPSTGTVQVSPCPPTILAVYAMREPSGTNTGLILFVPSCVS